LAAIVPARAARAVLDDHRLAERGTQSVGEDPRHDVGRTARRRRHDEPDRPIGEGVRGLPQQELGGAGDQDGDDLLVHGSSHRTTLGAASIFFKLII